MARFGLHLVCRASPSDLCKPDLAKPIPVSVSLSLTPQSAVYVSTLCPEVTPAWPQFRPGGSADKDD